LVLIHLNQYWQVYLPQHPIQEFENPHISEQHEWVSPQLNPSVQCLSSWTYYDRRTLPRYVDRVAAIPAITRQEFFHFTAGWGSDAFSCVGATGSEWQPGSATYDDPEWLRWSPR